MGTTEKKGTTVIEEVKFFESLDEAKQVVRKFERSAGRSDDDVSDSLAQHLLADTTGLLDEQWLGSEEEERAWCVTEQKLKRGRSTDAMIRSFSFVSELLYIHSKVMIVDDRRVIVRDAASR